MTSSILKIAIQNTTTSNTVFAYITGQALDNNNALFLLQSDGKTAYYPTSPSSVGSALSQDVAIPLGGPNSTTNVIIPRIAGGRIWFSVNSKLTFLLNPGPGLVEPSVTNTSDQNINNKWDFCEFTFNSTELYANISYVDFMSLPISLTLTPTSGATQHVSGMPANGLDTLCGGLTAQHAVDGAGWDRLVVTNGGANLRALSPNNGIVMNSSLFSGYFDPYITQVWAKYANSPLSIDTQAEWGTLTATTSSGALTFAGVGSFAKPTARDIFSCSTGPFGGLNAEMGNLAARITAAFNRSTLLVDSTQPDGELPANYYKTAITNHYGRILHATNLDGRGYAFPYDDVGASGSVDQSGAVVGNPSLLTIAVGGGTATAGSGKAATI